MRSGPSIEVASTVITLYLHAESDGRILIATGTASRIESGWVILLHPKDESADDLAFFKRDGQSEFAEWASAQLDRQNATPAR